MIDWLTDNAGLTGLLFFFSVFLTVALWAFRPGAKQTIEAHKYIPLDAKAPDSSDLGTRDLAEEK
jgi:cbb3-type cytochrome oxidase subunit 3